MIRSVSEEGTDAPRQAVVFLRELLLTVFQHSNLDPHAWRMKVGEGKAKCETQARNEIEGGSTQCILCCLCCIPEEWKVDLFGSVQLMHLTYAGI